MAMVKVSKEKIIKRMNYLIGHLSGVAKMIAEDKYCIDIINQNQGVMAALTKVNQQILRRHLDNCIVKAVKGKSLKKRQEVFDEVVRLFERS